MKKELHVPLLSIGIKRDEQKDEIDRNKRGREKLLDRYMKPVDIQHRSKYINWNGVLGGISRVVSATNSSFFSLLNLHRPCCSKVYLDESK